MLLQSYTSPNSWSLLAISNPNNKLHYNHNHGHPKRTYCLLKIGVEDIAEVFHNKVGLFPLPIAYLFPSGPGM